MKLAATVLLFALTALVGCAATPAESEARGETGQAQTRSLNAELSTAFAIDYAASGSIASLFVGAGRFDEIDREELTDALPEGDARAAARCLAAREDSVQGDTLEGLTWTYEDETFYVLVVALDDMRGLRDLHMVHVFASDGTPAFQALTWDGKKNVKITSGRSACPAASGP